MPSPSQEEIAKAVAEMKEALAAAKDEEKMREVQAEIAGKAKELCSGTSPWN